MRAVVERLQVLERVQVKTTPAPEPVVPKPSGSKPAGLAVSVQALGSVGAAAHGRRQLQSEGRKGRRLSVEGAKCADEGGTCTCDGLIYLGTRYVSGSPGSGAENWSWSKVPSALCEDTAPARLVPQGARASPTDPAAGACCQRVVVP